jgi:conjugal transfer pilus assembly protein TraL
MNQIPQYLDEPARFFIFTVDELIVTVVPILVLTIMTNFLIGVIVGSSCFWALRKLKRGGGLNKILWNIYWLLPTEVIGLKKIPRSDARLYVG